VIGRFFRAPEHWLAAAAANRVVRKLAFMPEPDK
jgi:hypothetical protein